MISVIEFEYYDEKECRLKIQQIDARTDCLVLLASEGMMRLERMRLTQCALYIRLKTTSARHPV